MMPLSTCGPTKRVLIMVATWSFRGVFLVRGFPNRVAQSRCFLAKTAIQGSFCRQTLWLSSTSTSTSTTTKTTITPDKTWADSLPVIASSKQTTADSRVLNLSTVTQEELEEFVVSLGHPKFRASQVWQWIRGQGVTNVDQMNNLPKTLRAQLSQFSKSTSLQVAFELKSKDGTIKRAYQCHDGQVIESVLMPYEDGRYTACISSQAGCAQGCVFCATGQMGFSRQLTSDEIFEQVARFANELQQLSKQEQQQQREQEEQKTASSLTKNRSKPKTHGRTTRLSNIVFMGMGEPLANLRNVKTAIQRINQELGIGARRITISTVGIVPNIRKLYQDADMPPVRLAVSLHCASDEERSALLPVNKRYGGLRELMASLDEYMTATGQRITLEWALIEGKNDGIDTARQLGRLITQGYDGTTGLRRDMVHVNVIPLNPTGGYGGSPSGRQRVDLFCQTLEQEFGIPCTPRVRRGIDIDAGCGQLKAKVLGQDNKEQLKGKPTVFGSEPGLADFMTAGQSLVGVYETTNDDGKDDELLADDDDPEGLVPEPRDCGDVAFDEDDFDDVEYAPGSCEQKEADRLIALVKGTTIKIPKDVPSTSVEP